MYITLRSNNQASNLAFSNSSIDNWFDILSSIDDYDPFATVFYLRSDYKNRDEYIIKSSFLFDMLNGSLILLGKEPCLYPLQLIEENKSIEKFQDYNNKINYIHHKVFDVPYEETIFNDFIHRGRMDLAFVYLSNFDHYCRFFLYVLAKSKVDFMSLYKLKETLDDRINYYTKKYTPSNISQKNFKKELENIVYQQNSIPRIIDTFTKFANKYVYVGQIARHGLQLTSIPGALTTPEKKMSPQKVVESASKVIFSAIIMSLIKISFMDVENLARIDEYKEEEFIFEEEISDIDLSDFLF